MAICAVASVARKSCGRLAPDGCPAWPFNVGSKSGLVLCRAGKRPNSKPVATESAAANSRTVPSMLNLSVLASDRQQRENQVQRPLGDEDAREAAGNGQQDHGLGQQLDDELPATRADRQPDGHLAERAAARASRRLAMLAQAMSRTRPVTPSSSFNGVAASCSTELWPRAPSSIRICLALNLASV